MAWIETSFARGVHALKQLNPDRFEPGKPMFQLLFLDADLIV